MSLRRGVGDGDRVRVGALHLRIEFVEDGGAAGDGSRARDELPA